MFIDSKVFSGYSVNDIDAAKSFYSDVLGIAVDQNWMGLQLKFRDNLVIFLYEKSDHQPATFTVLNLPVENIDQTVDELAAKGVIFEKYDNLPTRQDEKGILRGIESNMGPDIAWFKDPAGNILSILQES